MMQYMSSKQSGAPQMSGADGSDGQILQVLDACLLNGFGGQQVSELTQDGDVITLKFGVSHTFLRFQIITLSGANDAALNGDFRVQTLTSGELTINAPGVTDLTGIISVRVAAVGGWESIFGTSDPLKRAYRSLDVSGNRNVLYLDCQKDGDFYNATRPTQMARVDVCRDMTTLGEQIDSFTKYYNDQYTDGRLHWVQSRNSRMSKSTDTANCEWFLLGDGKLFYFGIVGVDYRRQQNDPCKALYWFGDTPKLSSADLYNTTFCAENFIPELNPTSSYYGPRDGFYQIFNANNASLTNQGACYVTQPDGTQGIAPINSFTVTFQTDAYSSRAGLSSNDPITLGLTFAPVFFETPNVMRGQAPYMRFICNNFGDDNDYSRDLTIYDDRYLFLLVDYSTRTTYEATYLGFDMLEERTPDVVG